MFCDLKNIYLRELRRSDLEGNWYKWFNDDITTMYQNKKIYPNTYEKQLQYYEHLQNTNNDVVLAIIDKETQIHIGNIGLHQIDYIHRRCEIGIVIGEKNFLSKGYGTKCVEAISKYAFETLNLNRITALVMEKNIASVALFKKANFKNEGTLKQYFYKNGTYMDVIVMSLIR